MDAIWPTITFFGKILPLLLFLSLTGFQVGKRNLTPRQKLLIFLTNPLLANLYTFLFLVPVEGWESMIGGMVIATGSSILIFMIGASYGRPQLSGQPALLQEEQSWE